MVRKPTILKISGCINQHSIFGGRLFWDWNCKIWDYNRLEMDKKEKKLWIKLILEKKNPVFAGSLGSHDFGSKTESLISITMLSCCHALSLSCMSPATPVGDGWSWTGDDERLNPNNLLLILLLLVLLPGDGLGSGHHCGSDFYQWCFFPPFTQNLHFRVILPSSCSSRHMTATLYFFVLLW